MKTSGRNLLKKFSYSTYSYQRKAKGHAKTHCNRVFRRSALASTKEAA